MKKQDIYIIIISVIAAFVLSLFIKHSINSPEAFFSIVIASESEFSGSLLERLLNTPNFRKMKYDDTCLKIGILK